MKTFHFLDIENLTGSSAPTADQISRCLDAYSVGVPVKPGDEVYLASAHKTRDLLRREVGRFVAARVQVLSRSGKDGADLALLERLERVYGRYSKSASGVVRVILGSGDNIFLEAVSRLRTSGKFVLGIVALEFDSMNRQLFIHNPTQFLVNLGYVSPKSDRRNFRDLYSRGRGDLEQRDPRDYMTYTVKTRDFRGVERTRVFIADGLPTSAKTGVLHAIDVDSPAWRAIRSATVGTRFYWLNAAGHRVDAEILGIAA